MTGLDRPLLAAVPMTVTFVVDEGGTIVEVYGEHLACMGLAPADLTGRTLAQLFGAAAQVLLALEPRPECKATLLWQGHVYEVCRRRPAGMPGDVYYCLDTSRCNSVESQLSESLNDLASKKEELQAVFDLAANGISILDRQGTFRYANRFFQRMMGYTMEELIRESCISLSSQEYAEASEQAVKRAIREGSVINFRKVCVTKGGEHINASMSLSYLKSRGEILMITSDITQDVRYQNELKRQVEAEVAKRTEQYEMLCHQSRLAAMGEMIDAIAHQWRQPLNGLGLIVQGMRRLDERQRLDTAALRGIEDEIMEKVGYMSQTIDDFSTFFRLSKRKERFDAAVGVRDALRLLDVQLKHQNVAVEIRRGEGERDVFGFSNEFRQVIVNLVHNAMTAIARTGQHDGRIEIAIGSGSEMLSLSVTDNGGGIGEEDFGRVFDPYFTTRENGNGIGLYMAKVIIEQHMGGRLDVVNHEGGARFSIELPVRKEGGHGSDS